MSPEAQVLVISFVIALAFTFVVAKIRGRRRVDAVVGQPTDPDRRLEVTYHRVSPSALVDRLGPAKVRSLASEPYPIGDAARRPGWWYLRRRVVTELTKRSELAGEFLQEFYALPTGGENAPDDLAKVRQAVLSYMLGPEREIFPFDDVPVQPPMPVNLFLICRETEEPHPITYPGQWHWMTVAEFAKIVNPNSRLGEHFVVEPPTLARDGQSARVRFRWGTPPGVYLQEVEVVKRDEIWAVSGIRDTFKLR